MSIRRWNVLGFFVCLLVSVPVGQARQQTVTNAVIAGTIVDRSGGTIPGAVVALEQQGKTLLTTTTDSAGKFRFERVAAGEYQVRASLSGFKTAVLKATVAAGATIVDLRVLLEVGALAEKVTVTAGTQVVQSSVSSTISSSTINGLPQSSINITIDGVRNSANQVTFLPGVPRHGSDLRSAAAAD